MSNTQKKVNPVSRQNPENDAAIQALGSFLSTTGIDAADLQVALEAITQAKEISNEQKKGKGELTYCLNKTLIYEDQNAFIYQREDIKAGTWYFWIYDPKRSKPVRKSLRTTDKNQAIIEARLIYIDLKGKIERGEKLQSITTPELIERWEKITKEQITDVPHEGITYGAYKVKRRMWNNWLEYIEHLGLTKTPIDKIHPDKTRDFGTWMKNKPKQGYKGKPRSSEVINSNMSEVMKMYRKFAVREKFVGKDALPEMDRLKLSREQAHKRDVLTEEQYEKLWRYIQYNYITKKHNPDKLPDQLEKRKIWKELIFIMSNVGFRPKELLGIKINEIMDNPNWDPKQRETDVLMKVRRENSKTGRSRVCVAPVKKRIDRVLASYKKLGVQHEPNDFLFMNPDFASNTRNHYTRDVMSFRLKTVLKESGLEDDLKLDNKNITLYSFRHQYASWRLRYGDVPIHLLAKQMGTSVRKIEETYGHIQVELQAALITKSQEHIKRTGFILSKPEVIDIDS